MIISGLQKTTLLDYPGHVAATIFLGGCNFRCPFCHNMNIVEIGTSNGSENLQGEGVNNNFYSEDEILAFLQKRASVLEGVCITGGEPTLNKELPSFIRKIKSIKAGDSWNSSEDSSSFLIKLDTNGTNPEMLKSLIDEGLIDYVAMDIKSSKDKYLEATGIDSHNCENIIKGNSIIEKVQKSIDILIESQIEYEFRTTVVKQMHDGDAIRGIGELIKGAKKHYLQSFIDSEYVKDHTLTNCDKELLEKFRNIIAEYVDEAYIRGVD